MKHFITKCKIMKIFFVVICLINNNKTSLLLFYLCVTRWRSLISALSNQIWGQDRSMARWRTPIKPPWTCPTCSQKRVCLTVSNYFQLSVNKAENESAVGFWCCQNSLNKPTSFTCINLAYTYKWNKKSSPQY